MKLYDIEVGKTFTIGVYEFIVLEHYNAKTAVLLKDVFCDGFQFGDNNNFRGSKAEVYCNAFSKSLAELIGEENIVEHDVDLTAANGMKCYGSIPGVKASLLTLERLQKYSYIILQYPVDDGWWLSTPCDTPNWGTGTFVLFVSSFGRVDGNGIFCEYCFRPFCILNSSISVPLH